LKSLFFDSQVDHDAGTGLPTYDRPVSAEDLRNMISAIVSTGVYPTPSTSFQVLASVEPMSIEVRQGLAWIKGAFAIEDVSRVLVLQASSTTLDRIDRVVLRLDLAISARNIDLYVLQGTPSLTPVAPSLTQNNTVWEIALADVFVAKNTTVVTQQRITDTRGDATLCGWVSGVVDQVDTTTIFNQFQAWFADTVAQWQAWWTGQQGGIEGYMLQSTYDSTNSGIVDDSEKLGGLDPKFYKSAILKFKGGATALPAGTAYGLLCNEEMVNTAGISYTWDNRDFVIPQGFNFVRFWGGMCGIGGTAGALKDFGWVKCDPVLNGVITKAGLPNASALTFCSSANLGITHSCYTPIAEAYVSPGDKIGLSVYCTQNSFWMYSKLFCIELMNV